VSTGNLPLSFLKAGSSGFPGLAGKLQKQRQQPSAENDHAQKKHSHFVGAGGIPEKTHQGRPGESAQVADRIDQGESRGGAPSDKERTGERPKRAQGSPDARRGDNQTENAPGG